MKLVKLLFELLMIVLGRKATESGEQNRKTRTPYQRRYPCRLCHEKLVVADSSDFATCDDCREFVDTLGYTRPD